jgi:hypothetical protein
VVDVFVDSKFHDPALRDPFGHMIKACTTFPLSGSVVIVSEDYMAYYIHSVTNLVSLSFSFPILDLIL